MSSNNELIALSRDLCLATHVESWLLPDVIDRVNALKGETALEDSLRRVAEQFVKRQPAKASCNDGWSENTCDQAEDRFWGSFGIVKGGMGDNNKLWVSDEEPVLYGKKAGASTALGLRSLSAVSGVTFPRGTLYAIKNIKNTTPIGYTQEHAVDLYAYDKSTIKLYPQRFVSPEFDINGFIEHIGTFAGDWSPYSRFARFMRRNRY